MGSDLNPDHAKVLNQVGQLLGGLLRVLQRNRAQAEETRRVLGDEVRQDLVEGTGVSGALLAWQGVGTELCAMAHELDIDPSFVHGGETRLQVE
jgi:hypothetical protein